LFAAESILENIDPDQAAKIAPLEDFLHSPPMAPSETRKQSESGSKRPGSKSEKYSAVFGRFVGSARAVPEFASGRFTGSKEWHLKAGIGVTYTVEFYGGGFIVQLWIPNNESAFVALEATESQLRAELAKELPGKDVQLVFYTPRPPGKVRRIYVWRDGDIDDAVSSPDELIEWALTILPAFKQVLDPHLRKLGL
jgi:hypothetical protein